LNGTPVTNTEEDLFCQWYFLDPRILGYTSYYSFAANHLEFHDEYNYVVRAHNTDLLVNKIAPYTYQIKKNECLALPKKSYSSRYYDMTWKQKDIYYSAMDEILMDISVEEFTSYTLFQLFTALQKVISGITPEDNNIFDKPINNPRIKALFDIIDNLPEEKTIIWCKYQHEINTIKRILSDRFKPGKVAEYWGELSEREKNRQLDKFENKARFLVANKSVGAFGLNLQFCNYAIYYSNDFNWATRKQSEDRIHRAGQENNVHIIDVVCRESIDERIQEVLHQKGSLVNSFKRKIDDMKDKEDLRRWINNAEKVSEKECV
ncbi:MAG: helicase-related protein, partial [bacterium]